MVARMLNKETGEETVLIERTEIDKLNDRIKALEKQLKMSEAFYRLAEIELDLYKSNWVCRAALSVTLFFRKLLGGDV